MTEIGRQQWELYFDIESAAVPIDERADGEGVTKIVDPRTRLAVRQPEQNSGYSRFSRVQLSSACLIIFLSTRSHTAFSIARSGESLAGRFNALFFVDIVVIAPLDRKNLS